MCLLIFFLNSNMNFQRKNMTLQKLNSFCDKKKNRYTIYLFLTFRYNILFAIVGGNKHLFVRSLGTLYQMCMTRKKTDHYNYVLIDDILADDENFDRYFLNITGYKLVETSFFHIEYDINKNKYEMYMNYPCNNIGKNSWAKLIFADKKMFFDYYKKFKDAKHIEPIIIAGNWINVKNDSKCFASCIINKTSQIYIEKERD